MRRLHLIVFIISIVTVVVIVSTYLILKDFQRKSLQFTADPFLWISDDAEFIFHSRKPALLIESFAYTGLLGKNITLSLGLSNAYKFIQNLDSLLNDHPTFQKIWEESELVFSLYLKKDLSGPSFIAQLNLPLTSQNLNLDKFLRENIFSNFEIENIEYGNETVYKFFSANENFYCSIRDNSVIFSTELENPGTGSQQDQIKKSLSADNGFNLIRKAAGQFSDNLYFRTSKLCKLADPEFLNDFPLNIGCENLAGWQVWDVSYDAAALILSGLAQSEVFGEKFTDNLAGQEAVSSNITEYISLSSSAVVTLGLSDTDKFAENIHDWLEITQQTEETELYRRKFTDITATNPDSLPQIWNGKLAWVKPEKEESEGILILGVDSLMKSVFEHKELSLFITDEDINYEDETIFAPEIKRISIPGFFHLLTYGLVKDDFTFFSITGNYLIASKSIQPLVRYLEKIRFGYSLANSEEMEQINELMRENQNLFFYFSNPLSGSLSQSEIKTDSIDLTIASQRKKFSSFSLQLYPAAGNMAYSNALLFQWSEYETSNPLAWETELETPVNKGPYPVINHNDGFEEYILQDWSNILYLINDSGEILWQKELSGPIMSDIYQVDIFKNERLQYLFNTRNYLHLIDRNGAYVRGYPMRFPSPATAGIAVFDYDSNKNYRILFPAVNRRIYNYNLRRKMVTGWEFKQSDAIIKQPLQHFRINEKDYIFIADSTGKIMVLDRTGKHRIRPKSEILITANGKAYGYEPENGKPGLIIPGENGKVQQLLTDGTVFTLLPDSLSDNYQFALDTFSREFDKDLIFYDNGAITVYNMAEKILFSAPVRRNMNPVLQIIKAGNNNRYVALSDSINKQIFLMNASGEIIKPFPLLGDTPIIINTAENGNYYVVTGFNSFLRMYEISN